MTLFNLFSETEYFRNLKTEKSEVEYRKFACRFITVVIIILEKHSDKFDIGNKDEMNQMKDLLRRYENMEYNQDFILNFVKLLFFQDKNYSMRKDQCLTMVALVVCLLNDSRVHCQLNELSRRVAKLIYFMKVSTLALVHEETKGDLNVLQRKNIELLYMKFYHKTENNPIMTLIRFAKYVASFGTGDKLPSVYWVLDSSFTNLQVGLTTISIRDLQEAAYKGNNLIKSFFVEKLLMNFHWDVPNILADELNDSSDGFYFVHDKRNNLRQVQDRFHSFLVKGGFKNRIEEYVSNWRRFIQLLIFNIHLTSGNPARGTELETLQFRNSSLKNRNVYVFQDKIALIPTYNKTNNLKGSERLIPRFLPKELSHILIKYLVLVQPVLEQYYAKISYRPSVDVSESKFLFSSELKSLSTEQIKDDFMTLFREICGKEIKFAMFRHVVDAFGLRHIEKFKSDSDAYETFALQAGHTSMTASKNYGAISNDFRQVDRETCQRMYAASASWHRFLGIVDNEDTIEPVVDLMRRFSISGQTNKNTVPSQTVKTVVEQQTNQVKSQEAVNQVHGRSALFERNVVNLESSENNDFNIVNSIDTLKQIKNLLKNDSATFSCDEQAITASEVMKRENDILAIIPTGFGKTMTIFASVKSENLVTVFIYPLIGIKNMMLKKCMDFGISCEEYSSERPIGQSSIILVSTKTATTESFINVLARLYGQGLLARIVIDEVHLCIQWNNFRTEYELKLFTFLFNFILF